MHGPLRSAELSCARRGTSCRGRRSRASRFGTLRRPARLRRRQSALRDDVPRALDRLAARVHRPGRGRAAEGGDSRSGPLRPAEAGAVDPPDPHARSAARPGREPQRRWSRRPRPPSSARASCARSRRRRIVHVRPRRPRRRLLAPRARLAARRAGGGDDAGLPFGAAARFWVEPERRDDSRTVERSTPRRLGLAAVRDRGAGARASPSSRSATSAWRPTRTRSRPSSPSALRVPEARSPAALADAYGSSVGPLRLRLPGGASSTTWWPRPGPLRSSATCGTTRPARLHWGRRSFVPRYSDAQILAELAACARAARPLPDDARVLGRPRGAACTRRPWSSASAPGTRPSAGPGSCPGASRPRRSCSRSSGRSATSSGGRRRGATSTSGAPGSRPSRSTGTASARSRTRCAPPASPSPAATSGWSGPWRRASVSRGGWAACRASPDWTASARAQPRGCSPSGRSTGSSREARAAGRPSGAALGDRLAGRGVRGRPGRPPREAVGLAGRCGRRGDHGEPGEAGARFLRRPHGGEERVLDERAVGLERRRE